MKYFVYLLISLHKKRLKLHNTSKGAKFTRGRKWQIIYKKKYRSKSIAMKNEYLLKNNKKKRLEIKKKFIIKYKNNK